MVEKGIDKAPYEIVEALREVFRKLGEGEIECADASRVWTATKERYPHVTLLGLDGAHTND